MKVTEQIDALRSMAINPFSYLYVPRMIALLFMMPIWLFCRCCGLLSGMVVYKFFSMAISSPLEFGLHMLTPLDIYAGILYKAPLGQPLALSTFIGSKTKRGAVGIGFRPRHLW